MDEKTYGEECLAELKGTKLENVTPQQAIEILQPVHAPENFYCDGEIGHKQAFSRWKMRLVNSGLTKKQVAEAVRIMFV